VTELRLLESHLGPKPTYDTVESWALSDVALRAPTATREPPELR